MSLRTPPLRGVVLRVIRSAAGGRREVYGPVLIPLRAEKLFGPFSGDQSVIISVRWAADGEELALPSPGMSTDPEELISAAMDLLGQARELLAERISRAGS